MLPHGPLNYNPESTNMKSLVLCVNRRMRHDEFSTDFTYSGVVVDVDEKL